MSIALLIIIYANPQDLFSCTIQFLTTSRQYFCSVFLPCHSFSKTYQIIFPQERCCSHRPENAQALWKGHSSCLGPPHMFNTLWMFQEFPIALSLFREGSWIWPEAKPGCVGLEAKTVIGLFKKKSNTIIHLKLGYKLSTYLDLEKNKQIINF